MRALRTFRVDSAFPLVTLACSQQLELVSRVKPNIREFYCWYDDIIDGEVKG